jgi:hypothetical protein
MQRPPRAPKRKRAEHDKNGDYQGPHHVEYDVPVLVVATTTSKHRRRNAD